MSPGSLQRMRRRPAPPTRQRGVALLVAILLVALGTILAATIGYQNAVAARRSVATFAFDQNLLISQGAEALAAYGLREVKRSTPQTTDLSQGWAKPVGPLEIVPGVMLDASLEDVSGRFNLNRLYDESTGRPNKAAFDAFVNLLEILQMETTWADKILDWIDPDTQPTQPDGAEDSVYLGQDPPYVVPNKYITSTSELLALPGFGRERYQKLAPYITALPPDVVLNVCTASGPVLDAFMGSGQRTFSTDPDALAKNRANASGCFPKKDSDYSSAFENKATYSQVASEFKETSSYFRLTSHVTIGSAEFNLYSLLYQEGTGNVRPIQRSFSPD
jgi:general secretion pathway protein K